MVDRRPARLWMAASSLSKTGLLASGRCASTASRLPPAFKTSCRPARLHASAPGFGMHAVRPCKNVPNDIAMQAAVAMWLQGE